MKELHARSRPLKARILEFLQAHSDQAFALHEIWGAMNSVTNASVVGMMLVMLKAPHGQRVPEVVAIEELLSEGVIASNTVDGVRYVYAVTK
ncbi:MAG: hypothetical protein JNK05_02205 [Myxococcales bacterium]|nr:hypothetical protein [Myxococcales bacterium]